MESPLFQCYLFLNVLVCLRVCILFICTISISIFCVSQEELSLIASNQQIYDFYKWVIFEKKIHWGKQIFDISELFSVTQIASVGKYQMVLIYIYMAVSVYWPLSVLCVFVCMCVCHIKSEYEQITTECVGPQ